jgi:integrase/recombinase XerC
MEIASAQQSFVQYLRYEKRFSEHTITAYSGDLSQFLDYCSHKYDVTMLPQVSSTLIRSWIAESMEEGMGPRSIGRKISTLKSFYRYLLRRQLVSADPMLKIQSPKVPKKLPVFVERDKMDQLLDNVDFGSDFEGIRNRLILELFYGTGMRLSELIGLQDMDVDLYSSQLKVLGKRNKERVIPFNAELGTRIAEYREEKEKLGIRSLYLLTNKKGEKLYEKLVYGIVKSYLSQVTTVSKRSPHVLRHTFATHMLNNGAELNAIKEILGHASLAATQVYTHNTVEKLKSIHKQAHPKA